jgi:hypothetical protein
MISKAVSIAFIAPALASGAILVSAGAAFAVPRPFAAILSGSNEVPAGDAGLTGRATVTIDVISGQVCTQGDDQRQGRGRHAHPPGRQRSQWPDRCAP